MRRGSKLLHYGAPARPGPANPRIVRASTILHGSVAAYRDTKRRREEDDAVLSYGRRGTTTAHALQAAIADLEAAEAAYLFPTGVAALAGAIQAFLRAGDHVLASDSVFSPTRKQFDQMMVRFGVEVSPFPPETGDLTVLVRPSTRLLFLESPDSQTFDILDLPALTAQARERGIISMADNTYASGWLSQPIALGCDVSVIAGTKYLGGHADVMMGAAAASAAARKLRQHVLLTGQTLAPDESYNMLRGTRTLGLRFARHRETGVRLARWFAARPEVLRVLHPALDTHPKHEIWKRDFSGAAGLFSADLTVRGAPPHLIVRKPFGAFSCRLGGRRGSHRSSRACDRNARSDARTGISMSKLGLFGARGLSSYGFSRGKSLTRRLELPIFVLSTRTQVGAAVLARRRSKPDGIHRSVDPDSREPVASNGEMYVAEDERSPRKESELKRRMEYVEP